MTRNPLTQRIKDTTWLETPFTPEKKISKILVMYTGTISLVGHKILKIL